MTPNHAQEYFDEETPVKHVLRDYDANATDAEAQKWPTLANQAWAVGSASNVMTTVMLSDVGWVALSGMPRHAALGRHALHYWQEPSIDPKIEELESRVTYLTQQISLLLRSKEEPAEEPLVLISSEADVKSFKAMSIATQSSFYCEFKDEELEE